MDADFLLIQKMKNGDEQAINDFVKKYYNKILKYCHLHICDYGEAEDMTQETFQHFFQTLPEYQHYGKAVNYLYVIAANRGKDYYKKKKDILVEELPEQSKNSMEEVEGWLEVRMALETLPDELREIAILFFFQGMKQKEIAKILGIGLPLVKYRVRRAKELLVCYFGMEVRG